MKSIGWLTPAAKDSIGLVEAGHADRDMFGSTRRDPATGALRVVRSAE
jgi:hypothetical protein